MRRSFILVLPLLAACGHPLWPTMGGVSPVAVSETYQCADSVAKSLGYKQAAQFLRGEINSNVALCATQQGHRNYAKRQMTWFRREPDVNWLHGFGDSPAIESAALTLVREFAN